MMMRHFVNNNYKIIIKRSVLNKVFKYFYVKFLLKKLFYSKKIFKGARFLPTFNEIQNARVYLFTLSRNFLNNLVD